MIRILFIFLVLMLFVKVQAKEEKKVEFSVWKVVDCLGRNKHDSLKEMLSGQLQEKDGIEDQIKNICQFVSGLPVKKEITCRQKHIYNYDTAGNIINDTVVFRVRFRTQANLSYKMIIKWCKYCPKNSGETGISYISVHYLGQKEDYISDTIKTVVTIKQ